MAREAGHTQGFGRVSPETRPSPYSPLHYRPSPPSREALPKRRPRRRRWPLAAGVAAAIIGGLLYAILFRTPTPPTRAVVVAPVPAAPAPPTLNDEAQRLSRSAIAAPRR